MRILYFSDGYAYGVMGTKRSIQEELVRRGNSVIYQNKAKIPDILKLIKTYNPDQVWLAHSFVLLPSEVKKKAGIPIVGFGFSDPYNFVEARLSGYSVYITNHFKTYEKYKGTLPVHYNPTACDFRFHRNLRLKKDIDISFIGLAEHPHFKNKRQRIDIVRRLAADTKFKISAWGNGWPNKAISGMEFLRVINRSRIGLDIQDEGSPLAHRMFEYSACSVPIITKNRPEIERVFKPGKEILVYDSYDELKEKLVRYLRSPELDKVALNARKRCVKDHDIKSRVDKILGFLEGALGG